jgi:hypothetical protein
MVDQPQSAVIREGRRVSPALVLVVAGCALGAGIAFAGHLVADRQQAALSAERANLARERDLLQAALSEAMTTGPRLRLEELAGLPLISEFLFYAAGQPDGPEARELADYLSDVLAAAGEETGLVRVALETEKGEVLLDYTGPAAGAGSMRTEVLEAHVASLEDPETQAGRLVGYLPMAEVALLPPAEPSAGTDETASVTAATATQGDALASGTRLFAFLAGLGVAVFGAVGGAVLGRLNTRSFETGLRPSSG